ncbi:MAG TPA: hypothetical protein VGC09_13535 [Rhodopila sp.]
MTPVSSRAVNPVTFTRRPLVSAISLLLLTSVLGAVLFIALRSPLKDDIAWLLYVAHRWMAGRELYIDVVEVNPPLIVWISAIPLEIARWLDVGSQFVAMPVFVAAVLACAWWAATLLRPCGGLFVDRLPVFAAIGSALLVLPAADLGQREHLLVAAFLPYLVLFAQSLGHSRPDWKRARLATASWWRLRRPVRQTGAAVGSGAVAEPGTSWTGTEFHASEPAADIAPEQSGIGAVTASKARIAAYVVAGVLAGLGCALKPRYAAVFAVLECVALTRGLRPWRVMPLVAGTTLVAYAGLVAFLCPAYLRRAVPMALALYGATDVPFLTLLADSALLLSGEAVAIGLLWLRRRSLPDYNLMLTLVVFAATSTVICFVDGKDWYYHRLPATVITVLALLLWSATELVQRRWRIRWPLIAAGLAVTVFCVSSIQQLEPEAIDAVEPKQTAVDRLEQILRAEHARTYIAFSEWIALGFPVVNETGVTWASRFDSMWALKGEVWRARFDPAVAKEWPIARWVAHDFIAGCPDIAVVDTRETTNYISVLRAADGAFARAWSRYRRIAAFDGLVVYRRGKGGCFDVWVAADAKPVIEPP